MAGIGVHVVEAAVVVVVVVVVVRRHLLDAGGYAQHGLHVQLWGCPAPRPSPLAPPSPHGSRAPPCLSSRAHGALALALGSLADSVRLPFHIGHANPVCRHKSCQSLTHPVYQVLGNVLHPHAFATRTNL